jgi:RNA polymerase sigma factor (sigma-70 family)
MRSGGHAVDSLFAAHHPPGVSSASLPAGAAGRPRRSRRLLALSGDERLVEQVRAGNEAAFAVLFERHAPAILSFCRHMLGSVEDAEDASQQVFVSAHRDLLRSEREVAFKPWLFTIARNRCLSMLRARRPESLPLDEDAVVGTDDAVDQRVELRELLLDLRDLPEEQRAALVLSELGDLSHPQIAEVLGVEAGKVKGIVFRARAGLAERREARLAPCEEIREELATASGGALRRGRLRQHLRRCPGCSAFSQEVRRQRSLMAVVLPVAPSAALKASVLGATGATGVGSGGLTGLVAAGSLGSGGLAKLAVAGVLAAGAGALGGTLESEDTNERQVPRGPQAPAAAAAAVAAPAGAVFQTSPAKPPAARARGSRRGSHTGQGGPARGETPARGGADRAPQGRPAPPGARRSSSAPPPVRPQRPPTGARSPRSRGQRAAPAPRPRPSSPAAAPDPRRGRAESRRRLLP